MLQARCQYCRCSTQQPLIDVLKEWLPYLRVRVYSPSSLLEASRTRKVPSGVSRSFSFTSSLQTWWHAACSNYFKNKNYVRMQFNNITTRLVFDWILLIESIWLLNLHFCQWNLYPVFEIYENVAWTLIKLNSICLQSLPGDFSPVPLSIGQQAACVCHGWWCHFWLDWLRWKNLKRTQT